MRTMLAIFLIGVVVGMQLQQEIIVRDLPNVPKGPQHYPWEKGNTP
jgi:hypothetical protein